MKTPRILAIAHLIAVAQLLAAASATLAQGVEETRPDSVGRVTLKIGDTVGNACPVPVNSALRRVDGGCPLEACFADRSAAVGHDTKRRSPEHIQRTIRSQIGFDTAFAAAF